MGHRLYPQRVLRRELCGSGKTLSVCNRDCISVFSRLSGGGDEENHAQHSRRLATSVFITLLVLGAGTSPAIYLNAMLIERGSVK